MLGTPNEHHWKDALKLPDFKPTFPKWKPKSIPDHVSGLDVLGMDLLVSLV